MQEIKLNNIKDFNDLKKYCQNHLFNYACSLLQDEKMSYLVVLRKRLNKWEENEIVTIFDKMCENKDFDKMMKKCIERIELDEVMNE